MLITTQAHGWRTLERRRDKGWKKLVCGQRSPNTLVINVYIL